MTTTTRRHEQARCGAFITSALGFTPEESVVIVTTASSGAIARISIDALSDDTSPALLNQVASRLRVEGLADVVVAYYTERTSSGVADIDARVTDALATMGLNRRATYMFDTAPVGIRHRDLGVINRVGLAQAAVAERARNDAMPDLRHYRVALGVVARGRTPLPAQLGKAAACLESTLHRDAIVALMTARTHTPSAWRTLPGPEVIETAMEKLLIPGMGERPDDSVAAHSTLLGHITSHMTDTHQAPARTLLGLIAWWHGDGALATRHIEEALSADPAYRLAVLLAHTLDRAIPPGWAAIERGTR